MLGGIYSIGLLLYSKSNNLCKLIIYYGIIYILLFDNHNVYNEINYYIYYGII